MRYKVLPQEGLKLIACITMLIDHIGAILFPSLRILRIIGRLSFPIYCFLLAEGAAHTKHAGKYALRLLICALISELPHDLAFGGQLSLRGLTVMVSLLLGFGMLWTMERVPQWWMKAGIIGISMVLAWLFRVSYGWRGILVMAVFALTRGKPFAWLLQAIGLSVLFWGMSGAKLDLGFVRFPVQCFGVLALIPIGLYSGQKVTSSRAVQWGFYLFYPLHLLILYILKYICVQAF